MDKKSSINMLGTMTTNSSVKIDIDEIVRKNSSLVRALCFRMTMNQDTANDAFQETWIEVVKNIHTFQNKSHITTWVYKIAVRTIMRHVRQERTYTRKFLHEYIENQIEFVVPPSSVDHEEWIKSTCNKCLTGFLYCLTLEDRILFILRDIGGIDYKILEEVLNIKSVTLRQRIVRIRKRLKNFLQDECILANPHAKCQCKIRQSVREIRLDQEFDQLKRKMKSLNVYKLAREIFPALEYWKEKLGIMSHSSHRLH